MPIISSFLSILKVVVDDVLVLSFTESNALLSFVANLRKNKPDSPSYLVPSITLTQEKSETVKF
jgi:hypothetical protein